MAKHLNPLMQKGLVIDIADEKEWDCENGDVSRFQEERCAFEDYLVKPFVSPLRCNKFQLYCDGHNTIFLNDKGEFRIANGMAFYSSPDDLEYVHDDKDFSAIQVPGEKFILINGDDGVGHFESLSSYFRQDQLENHPTISFACLGQFYGFDETVAADKISKKIASGELKIIDFSADESIELNSKELKKIEVAKRQNQAIKPPQKGFTLVGDKWHKPAAVVLHDTKKNWCILVGQDEGTYFGVELPKLVKTLAEGFDILMPNDARGKEFYRQGEWFFIKVPVKTVPEIRDCVGYNHRLNEEDVSFKLPIETEDSNIHSVSCSEFRVAQGGEVYVRNPYVEHNDHSALGTPDGWYIYRKNTALRSYSQEGVD